MKAGEAEEPVASRTAEDGRSVLRHACRADGDEEDEPRMSSLATSPSGGSISMYVWWVYGVFGGRVRTGGGG